MKLRGWTAELRIETGRWCGLRRDEWICKMCDHGEVNVEHFLLHCNGLADYGAIWGEHPGVYIIAYGHDVHLKIMNYEL